MANTIATVWARLFSNEIGAPSQTSIIALEVIMPPSPNADQIDLLTRIKALDQRLLMRGSSSMNEIRVLENGAAACAAQPDTVERGKILLKEAELVFGRAVQAANRNWYLLALLIGVLIVIGLASLAIWLAKHKLQFKFSDNLADEASLAALFTFAGMGSVTSVLTRLTSLDLRNELSKKFVIYMALAKPLVAISFASIVYVALRYNIISIGNWATEEAKQGIYWIAAFLCGFSERFASDILERFVPPDNNSSTSPTQRS